MPAPAAVPARTRLEWLDFYRGLAVLVMIETHVANTFLDSASWPEAWRVNLNYFNGLVAPSFLFIAGFAQGLGVSRRRARPGPVGRRLAHLAGIVAIGYAMHLPLGPLFHGRWLEAWQVGTRMDVLVCLGLSLLGLAVIEHFAGRALNSCVSLAAALALIAAPWLAGWHDGPALLVAAVNDSTGSLFPLLPWAAFVFCGFGEGQRTESRWRTWLPVALCGFAVALFGRANLSNLNPAFFFERLGWVLLLVPLCQWISARWSPRLVLFAGRESLVIYLAHLAMIEVLATILPRCRLGVGTAAALWVALIALSCAVAAGWRRFIVWRADPVRRATRLPESSAPAA